MSARREEIEYLILKGELNFSEIGVRVGLSHERVRQIARPLGVTGRGRIAERISTRLVAERARKEAEIARIINAWEVHGECKSSWAARIIRQHLAKSGKFRCCQCGNPKLLSEMAKTGKGQAKRCLLCQAENKRRWYRDLKDRDPRRLQAMIKRHNENAKRRTA